jgi:hypothetical protein
MDERGEQIRSQDVDCEHVLESVNGLYPEFAVPDARIMDNGVERSDGVSLVGNSACLSDTRQIADDYASRAGHCLRGLTRAICIARVQHDIVAGVDEALRSHLSEAVR